MNYADLWNTPGYFYAIGYALSLALVLQREKTLYGGAWKLLSILAAGGFFTLLLYVTRGSEGIVFVLSMLGVAGSMFLTLYLYTRDLPRAVFLAAKTFLYGEFTSSLTWQICYSLAVNSTAGRLEVDTAIAAVFLLVTLGLWAGEKWLHRENVEVPFAWREAVTALLIVLGVYVVSNLGYVAPGGLFSGSNARDIFAIRTLVDFSGVVLISSFHRQLIDVQYRLEQASLHSLQEMQYRATRLSQESIEMVDRKYHDLKHQLALLRTRAAEGKAEEYLDRMEKEIRDFTAGNRTGCPVLDAVLTNKSHACHAAEIEFKYIADGSVLGMLDDMEIAALFGNMLDNAIESAGRVPDRDKRLIRLYVSGEKGFARIRMENTCPDRLQFVDGLPVTTKQDKRYHGFGMKSIRRTVEKHGGSLVTGQNEDWFELKILIPMAGGETAAERK